MDKKESDKNPDESVDDELENLLNQVKDPLPASKSNVPVPISQETPVVEAADTPEEEISVDNDIKIVLDKFHGVTDKIINNYDCDRDEIGDAAERLRDLLISSPKPPEHIVAGYVAILKTKADANTNIIRLLDAFAKIISSAKNTNIINQSTSVDLSGLLDEDEDED